MKKGISIENILELYTSGKTPIEIAEQLGCTLSNVSRRLKKAGVHIKRDYAKTRYSRISRYKVNETYFDNIDTEDKAYFLGLMMSDGCVSNNCFYIKLIDEDILLKFKECLECENQVIFTQAPNPNWNNSYKLTICSKYMCKALEKLGCTKNKTKTLKFPNIKKELYRHFIRGFFDGDGCLQLQNKIYHCRFDLTCASKEFLEEVRPILTEHAKTSGYLGKETKYDVWHLNYSGHQVKQILDWIYKDSNYYLQRKYNKYKIISSR